MKAIWYEKQGDASDVLIFGEIAKPVPQNGEVLVKVSFSGLNPSDTKRRRGFRGQKHAFPKIIPHSDGSGVIEAVGSNVDKNRVGERVWLYSAQWQRPFGTAANFVCVPSTLAIPLADATCLEIAATIGIPALTAYAGMFKYSNLNGATILITGGGGSVGNCAIQMAKYAGAHVISSVSGQEKMTAALNAGADIVLRYDTPNFIEDVMDKTDGKKLDLIFDVAFGHNIETNLNIIKEHGIISTYASDNKSVAEIPFQKFLQMNITIYSIFMYLLEDKMMQDALQFINNWQIDLGIKPFIAKQYHLSETTLAHQDLESGNIIGNIIIDCQD